jgi:hypothetical protein
MVPKMRLLHLGSIHVRFLRRLSVPASESQLALTLALSLLFMAVMLLGLIWQANVIALQREIIHSLSGV